MRSLKISTSVAFLLFAITAKAEALKPIFSLDPAAYCTRDASGKYAGPFQVQSGHQENLNDADQKFEWAQGGGCIFRATRDAWGVVHNQTAIVWDGVSKSSFFVLAPVAGATHSYNVQYVVNDFITVKWRMQWDHALTQGTFTAPEQVFVNYRKVEGTSYISYWEGTVVLKELAPGVVGFAMRNQVDAAQTSSEDAAATVRDFFAKVTSAQPNLDPLKGR